MRSASTSPQKTNKKPSRAKVVLTNSAYIGVEVQYSMQDLSQVSSFQTLRLTKTAKFEGLHLLTSSPPPKKKLCVGNLMIIPARFQGLSVCSKHYPLTRQILYPSIFFQRRLDKWYLTSLAAPTR